MLKKDDDDFVNQTRRNNCSKMSWTLRESSKDSEMIQKACSMTDMKLESNYWKITEDDNNFLTCVASHSENPYLAIASGSSEKNLHIYDLNVDQKLLGHHQTISLPNIHSLKWLNNVNGSFNFLASGHSRGYVNLTLLPDPEGPAEQSAEIVKRFNHEKQLKTYDPISEGLPSTIKCLSVIPKQWKSCNLNTLMSLYKDSLFMWDSSMSRVPVLRNKVSGISYFDPSPVRDGILSIGGSFGVALQDLRAKEGAPTMFVPQTDKNRSKCHLVKWAPYDANVLASAHDDGTVQLWDVRNQDSFACLQGHSDSVSSIEWAEDSSTDIYTGGKDGKVIHWDLFQESESFMRCTLKHGVEACTNHSQIASTRQCGTMIPASNTSIIDLATIHGEATGSRLLSIDGSSFLGLHGKLGSDSFVAPEGTSNTLIDSMLEENKICGVSMDNASFDSLEDLALPDLVNSPINSTASLNHSSSSETLRDSLAKPSPAFNAEEFTFQRIAPLSIKHFERGEQMTPQYNF